MRSSLGIEQRFQIAEWRAGEKNNVLLLNTNYLHALGLGP